MNIYCEWRSDCSIADTGDHSECIKAYYKAVDEIFGVNNNGDPAGPSQVSNS